MKTSASWGSVSGGKICRRPSNGLKNGALTPANANSSWHRASSSRMISDVERQPAELAAPEPVAPAGDDVLLLEAGVGAVQARRGDQLAGHDLDQPAEHHHRDHRHQQRQDQPQVVRVVQDQEERRRGQQRDRVAARVSRRHSCASAAECWLIAPLTRGLSSAYAIGVIEGTGDRVRGGHLLPIRRASYRFAIGCRDFR